VSSRLGHNCRKFSRAREAKVIIVCTYRFVVVWRNNAVTQYDPVFVLLRHVRVQLPFCLFMRFGSCIIKEQNNVKPWNVMSVDFVLKFEIWYRWVSVFPSLFASTRGSYISTHAVVLSNLPCLLSRWIPWDVQSDTLQWACVSFTITHFLEFTVS
jgi:hypothetical protein